MDAKLLNVLVCHMVCILFVQVIFCSCLYACTVQLIIRVFHMDISFVCWFWFFSVFSGVFIAEGVDGIGDQVSGDSTALDIQTLLEVFFKRVPEVCLIHCRKMSSLLLKSKTSGLRSTSVSRLSWPSNYQMLDQRHFAIFYHEMCTLLV
jgi:hypothetical protein